MQEIQNSAISQTSIPNTPFRYFVYVSRPFKWLALGSILLVVTASVVAQGSAYIFKLIVDAVEAGTRSDALFYALMYPVVMFVVQLLFRVSGVVGGTWTVKAKAYSYDVLTKYLLGHSHSYFINRFSGSLMSKVNNVTGAIDRLIPDLLWMHLNAFVSFLVTFGFLLTIDVQAAWTFVALIVVLIMFNMALSKKRALYSKLDAEASTNFRARLVDVITNVQAVRQFVRRESEESNLTELTGEIDQTHRRNWYYTEWMLFWNSVILFGFSLLMFWSLVQGWQAGGVSTGELVLVLTLYAQITGTLIFIGRAFSSAARMVGEMQEGLDEIVMPYEIEDDSGASELLITEAEINWKHVQFSFAGNTVFADFNVDIAAGQRLGLVGQSGAGKTTFVSLLLRQHEIDAGTIEISGQNIAAVTQSSLRDAISVVPQEPALFHRSIRENILYGNSDATEDEVIAVAKKAQAHDFIVGLPEGYDTLVGERGVKLSGGQKQRIAIARAMLKDAPILVLDEATSALDSESEVAIQQALAILMEGRTVIAIAHRLSTLRRMDRIIVMESGVIVEDGTHQELAGAGGTYARLWDHQAGGFLQE